jgi:amino acid transporter
MWTEMLACSAIGSLCLLQLLSTWLSAKLISTLTIGKLVLVAAIGLIGMVDFAINDNDTGQLALNHSFVGTTTNPGRWVLAFTNCLFSFNGWNTLNLAAGEVRQPAVTIPLAIPIACVIVTASYLWINVAYFTAIPLADMVGSETLAVDFAEKVVGRAFAKIITFLVALSALATCNGTLFAGAQAVRESGRSRILPVMFAIELGLCGAKPTPAAALTIQCMMAAILVVLLESFEILVRIYVWVQWCFYALTICALVKLRWSEPGLDRPFTVWSLIPVVFVGVSVFIVVVLLFVTPGTCGVAVAVLLLGLPVYTCHMKRLKKQGLVWSAIEKGRAEAAPLLVEELDLEEDTGNGSAMQLL